MTSERIAIIAPELDLPNVTPRVGLWLVPKGARVLAGDRMVEIVANELSFDVSAPVAGRLIEKCVAEDTVCEAGECLGFILSDGF